MNLLQLASPAYLFETNPSASFAFLYALGTLFLLCIITGIVVQIFLRARKGDRFLRKYLKKAPMKLYTFGVLGLLFAWFRHEGIPYFAMRVWLVVLLLVMIVWIMWYLINTRSIARARNDEQERERMKRYQP